MDFQDFPRILGNRGVETDHPPKMCAGLGLRTSREVAVGVKSGPVKNPAKRSSAPGKLALCTSKKYLARQHRVEEKWRRMRDREVREDGSLGVHQNQQSWQVANKNTPRLLDFVIQRVSSSRKGYAHLSVSACFPSQII